MITRIPKLPISAYSAIAPVPGFALRLLYGEMAVIVTTGRRAVPRRALELGYRFEHPDLDEALSAALK